MKILSFFYSFICIRKKLFFFFLFILFSEVDYAQPDTWTKMADMPGAAPLRNRGVAFAINGKGYITTGWDGTTYFRDNWQYDPTTDSWIKKNDWNDSPLPPPRNRCCSFALNGKGYAVMGQDGSTFQGINEYSPGSDSWLFRTPITTFGGAIRYSSVSFSIDGSGYVATGYNGGSNYYNDLWQYNPPPADSWTQKANLPAAGTGRYSAVGFSIGNYGYVGTGWSSFNIPLNDFWQYNSLTNIWTQKANLPGPARALAVGFSIGNKGYIGTGSDGYFVSYKDMWEYDPANNSWTQRANFGGGLRSSASSFVINGEAYVGTGSVGLDSAFTKDLWKYTPFSFPPTVFQKTYGGTNYDTDTANIAYASPTMDGGYIISSTTKSFGSGGDDVYLIKTDATGNVQWQKTFGTTGNESSASAMQTSDGGYIVAGATRKATDEDMLVLKIKSDGSFQWSRFLGGSQTSRGNYAEETQTGGEFLIAGKGENNGNNSCLVKLDATGAQVLARNLTQSPSTIIDEGFSLEQSMAGNYVIGGNIRTSISTQVDAYVAVVNSGGTIVSPGPNRFDSPNQGNEIRAIIRQTADGGFIICGSSSAAAPIGHGGFDFFLVKIQNNFAFSWGKIYGGSNDDFGRTLAITSDGKFAVAGYTKSFGSGTDAFLSLLDVNGTPLWTKTYGGTGTEKANSVYQTADGGFILCGETYSFATPVSLSDIYLIKTDSLGNSGCNESVVSSLPTNTFVVSSTTANGTPAVMTVSTNGEAITSPTQATNKLCTFCTFPLGKNKTDVKCFGACTGTAIVNASTGALPLTYAWSTTPVQTTQSATGLCMGVYTVTVTDAAGCSATDTITIKQPPQLVAAIASSTVNICQGSSDTISATASGGDTTISAYTFTWSPPTNLSCTSCQNAVASPTSNTIYTITVKDGNLCAATNTVLVAVHQPTITAGPDQTICPGKSTTLIGNGNATNYTWTPPSGLSCTTCLIPVATPTITTQYSVIGTDAFGCSQKDSAIITVAPTPTVNISPNNTTICSGKNISLTANTNGNLYSWSTGQTSSSINVSPTINTAYTATVTNSNGCTATATKTVTVNAAPTPTFVVTNVSCSNLCNGKVTANPTAGTSPFTYLWSSPPQTTQTASNLCGGNFTVTVTDAKGCTASADTSIFNPTALTITVTPTNASCSCDGKASVAGAGGVPPYTYLWNQSGQTTSSISNLCGGTYSTTLTDANSCTFFSSATITQLPTVTVTVSSPQTICSGSNASLSATGGNSYSWSTGQSTSGISVSPTSVTNYTVFANNTSGCSDTGFVSVSVIQSPTATVTSPSTVCYGTSMTLTASGGGNYLWNTAATTSSINITATSFASYSVIVSSGICSDTAFTSVNVSAQATASITANGTTSICNGTSTTLSVTGGNIYSWSPSSGLSCTNCSNPVASPASTTTYIATASIGNCSDTAQIVLTVMQTPTVIISGNTSICTGQSATLTASGGNFYSWSSGQTVSFIIVSPTITATYSVASSNSIPATCIGTKTVTVTVSSSPQVISSASSLTICSGLSPDTLIASGGTNYSWVSLPSGAYPNNDTIIVSPDGTGANTYTVFVSNGSGCTGTSTVSINVVPGFSQPPVSPASVSYCIGDSLLPFVATPSTTPPAGIAWVDMSGNVIGAGNIFQPPQNTPVGTYSVYCIQGNSAYCLSYPTVVTMDIHSLPSADAGNDITICAGHTAHLNASGGTNYLWTPPTYLNDSSSANPSSSPDSTISYQVLVSDANNCKEYDSVTVYISTDDTCGIHIYNVISPNGDGDNDVWWIDGINLFPDNSVDVFNRWGNLVWNGKHYDNRKVVWRGQNKQNQPLPAGTYYYVIDVKRLGKLTGWVELLR